MGDPAGRNFLLGSSSLGMCQNFLGFWSDVDIRFSRSKPTKVDDICRDWRAWEAGRLFGKLHSGGEGGGGEGTVLRI